MIEKYAGVVAYINEKTGVFLSNDHVRKLAGRARDPVPVRRFLGRIVADEKDLDGWIARQWSDRAAHSPARSRKGR
jgi:hypothetical protein